MVVPPFESGKETCIKQVAAHTVSQLGVAGKIRCPELTEIEVFGNDIPDMSGFYQLKQEQRTFEHQVTLGIAVGYVVVYAWQLIEYTTEAIVPRLGKIMPGEVPEVREIECFPVEVSPAAQVIVEPLRQADTDTLVHIGFYPPVITRVATCPGDGLHHLDGEGRVTGVEILFPITIHPVILPGGIRQADRRCEVVKGMLIFLRRYSPVKGETGSQFQPVCQLNIVPELYVIMPEFVV